VPAAPLLWAVKSLSQQQPCLGCLLDTIPLSQPLLKTPYRQKLLFMLLCVLPGELHLKAITNSLPPGISKGLCRTRITVK